MLAPTLAARSLRATSCALLASVVIGLAVPLAILSLFDQVAVPDRAMVVAAAVGTAR